jgi:Ca-activated chloride channel family protein
MSFEANHCHHKKRFRLPFTASERRRGSAMVVGVCLFLAAATAEIEGQTSSPLQSAGQPAVAQPAPVPQATPATESNGTTTTAPLPQAQEQPPADGQDSVFVFKKEVQEVMLHATVVDERRQLVTNLDRAAFTVFEDGVAQATTSFHRDDVPVAMGIVIDNSGSMREKREKVNQAVLNLIRSSNPDDEIFVVNFSTDSYLDQDFTADINLLQQALEKVSTQGSTALYDAIVASAVHLKNNPRVERKVLLVITDGRDNASQETLQQATRRLQQENGTTVYTIGLLSDELQQSGTDALESLASSTGGVAFFPKGLDEVDNITRTVARDIRSQYTVGYKPTNPRQNSSYRKILVTAQARGYRHLTVRTRSGYYPGEMPR